MTLIRASLGKLVGPSCDANEEAESDDGGEERREREGCLDVLGEGRC